MKWKWTVETLWTFLFTMCDVQDISQFILVIDISVYSSSVLWKFDWNVQINVPIEYIFQELLRERISFLSLIILFNLSILGRRF